MATATSQTENKDNRSSARKIFKKIVDVFFTIVLLVAIITAVYIFQNKKTNGQVQIAGYQVYVVLSGSMSPTFDTGSIVIVKNIDPKDIAVNDIITFMGATGTGKTITHRVIEINTEDGLTFTTKGDANNVADSLELYPESVIGKVQTSVPYIGYFLEFSKTQAGLYFLIVLPSLIIILLEIRNIVAYLSERKKAKRRALLKAVAVAPTTEDPDNDERKDSQMRMIQEAIHSNSDSPNIMEEKPIIPNIAKTLPGMEKAGTIQGNSRLYQNDADVLQTIPESPAFQDPIIGYPANLQTSPPPADIIAKEEKSIAEIQNAAMEMITEAYKLSTQKIYQFQLQMDHVQKELQNGLQLKQYEEEHLDILIQQIKDRLWKSLNS
jgi:signal peptidase